MKAFKVYVICLTLVMTIILGAQLGLLIYGGIKIKDESSVLSTKVDKFNQSVNNINQSLQQVNAQLKKQTAAEQSATLPQL